MQFSNAKQLNCRHFNGYKPCEKNNTCSEMCGHKDLIETRIVIIHLGALGAVLRATSILPAVKRKYPHSHITWITDKPAHYFFENNTLVDRVITTEFSDLLQIDSLHFDVALVIDKSLKASGILQHIKTKEIFGFTADPKTFSIVPANKEAEELWEIGLNNQKKFYENQKPETQLITESLGLKWQRDPYFIQLSDKEKKISLSRKRNWSHYGRRIIVGINTGCSPTIPYKKLSVEGHRTLIDQLKNIPNLSLVLLGGKEDTERNNLIAEGMDVMLSPTDLGIRDGLVSVDACDIVITGDSLGMHMAIALNKFTVAWFGPTVAQEIDFYDRGDKVLAQVGCAPCWKRHCENTVMCYNKVNNLEIIKLVIAGLREISRNSNNSDGIYRRLTPQHTLDFET